MSRVSTNDDRAHAPSGSVVASDVAASGKNAATPDRLKVLSGPQGGASAILPRDRAFTLGTAPDNDVVLRSDEPGALTITVRCQAQDCSVSVHDGSLSAGERTVPAGETGTVPYETPIEAGGVSFSLHRGSAQAHPEERPSRGKRVPATNTVPLALKIAALASLTGGVFLVTLGAAVDSSRGSAAEGGTEEFQRRLGEVGLTTIAFVDPEGQDPAQVNGSVPSRQDVSRLRTLVRESEADVILDVQVDDELREAVEDVYRVNGVKADVQVTGLGSVRVATRTDRLDLLERIEQAVKSDLSGLDDLIRANVVPQAVVADEPTGRQNPDKTITLVVAGENGYVMTRDLARYFVGSTLPSGHVVEEITEGLVKVRKNGKETTLEF